MDKISIITPSFNQGQFIRQTILSVVNQGYENKEYLIIDGGSTDNTIEVIKEHSARIEYWVSETDNGQSNAINKGLIKSCGDILAWINSDDYYEDNVFHLISDYFKQNPNIDLLYFDVNNLSPSSTRVYRHQHEYAQEHFLTKVCLHQPGVFWRRRIMEKVGLLDENLQYVMDFDFWMRIYLNANIKYIPKVISN
jgi:glycosyltransferase involved in cell wall biosynthesis